ncbi:hypothetical protein LEP1GSC115_1449 [Leptospira interrogans serovar Australis str. 200703203]|uniref:Uncharacterized protein n=1 Tax=Leptospira interrogans serovar Australis str. 200703203 TaxID=1085541 RepID=N1UL66_LEPIR|nr:hypothetical protein LEP1GSC115_1449 [Leptospira interrogans serovar Australis str. 200703203]
MKYSCYKENLSWFSKILNFLGIYKLLQTYLEHEESIYPPLTRKGQIPRNV